MKKIYLVYQIYFVHDPKNGDGLEPLWCCTSLAKAKDDVERLRKLSSSKFYISFDFKVLELR